MAKRALKRYGLEQIAKSLITVGLVFTLFAWIAAAYYFVPAGGLFALFLVPFIFTCVSLIAIFVIRCRYTIFEKYPYLMNLPSIFYRIGQSKNGASKQSQAFSMIFTVHALVIAVIGIMAFLLTISIGSGINNTPAGVTFFGAYIVAVAFLIVSVFVQYRRIYIKFVK